MYVLMHGECTLYPVFAGARCCDVCYSYLTCVPQCMPHVCRACMPHVCRMYAACVLHVCRMCAACMLHACCMYAACVLHVCSIYVACMLCVCCIWTAYCATCLLCAHCIVACMLCACCVHAVCMFQAAGAGKLEDAETKAIREFISASEWHWNVKPIKVGSNNTYR